MSSIFDKTVCLSVTFRMPGCKRKASLQGMETDADRSELGLSKRIFASDSYRECQRIAMGTRKWLEARSVPSPLKAGTYLIPEPLVDSVEERLQEVTVEYASAADEFQVEYPWLVQKWQKKLGSHFNARDYPDSSEIRRRFQIERMMLNFSPARPDDIDQRQEIQSAIDEIKSALRCGLLELVQKLSGMLSESADGKRKRLTSKAVESFGEWMELLPARLIVDDDELKALADKARAIMIGKSVDDLRDVENVRSQTRKELQEVGDKLSKLVKDMPKRAFGFDDE